MPSKYGARQFDSLHRFVAVNSETGVAVEGCYSESGAYQCCHIFNGQAHRNGRPAIYDVRPIPVKLHNCDSNNWQRLLDEGEEVRQQRIEKLKLRLSTDYPGAFVLLVNQHVKQAGGSFLLDWPAVHDAFLRKSIGVDVRNPPLALSDILHLSPGAVTHAEQDIVCAQLDVLLRQHAQRSVHHSADAQASEIESNRPRG